MKLYIKEKDLLPEHYVSVNEPSFMGPGNHSVMQLESICEQFKELVHQLRVREQTLLEKFDISIVRGEFLPDCTSINRMHIIEDDNKCVDCGKDFSSEFK